MHQSIRVGTMTKLEITLIGMAQQRLDAILRFQKKRDPEDRDDYVLDSGALICLLELGHQSNSGMSQEAMDEMLKIEDAHATAIKAHFPSH